MKIRSGFVSNSSSSSYIVDVDLTDIGIRCVQIDPKFVPIVQDYYNSAWKMADEAPLTMDPDKTWYITRPVLEWGEAEDALVKLDVHGHIYTTHQLDGEPYDDWETYLVRYPGETARDDVYIKLEHTSACELTTEQLIAKLKEKFGDPPYRVLDDGDNIRIWRVIDDYEN